MFQLVFRLTFRPVFLKHIVDWSFFDNVVPIHLWSVAQELILDDLHTSSQNLCARHTCKWESEISKASPGKPVIHSIKHCRSLFTTPHANPVKGAHVTLAVEQLRVRHIPGNLQKVCASLPCDSQYSEGVTAWVCELQRDPTYLLYSL